MKRPVTMMLLAVGLAMTARAEELPTNFTSPPPSARARVYWFWLGGSITREGITADLEAMKRAGLGGTLMMNAYPSTPPVVLNCMSPEWWNLLKFANEESARLGLIFGTHNCPGWSTSGGPWITPELSMQKVVWSETKARGAGRVSLALPKPKLDSRWNYFADINVLAVPADAAQPAARESVMDLTGKMMPDGQLTWDAPAGDWTIFRFGHTTTGHMNGPPPTGGQGLECDKMNPKAAELHFNAYSAKIIEAMGHLAGKTFTNLEIDSYEAGPQNWTPRFREEFRARRGYDPLPWLPVLAERTLESSEKTGRFKWDMARTVAELYAECHYRPMAEMARARGIRMDFEPYGGPFDSQTVGGLADMPMGECWTSDWGWNTVTLAASAAHTHGKPLVGAEALTGQPMHGQWKQDPYALKGYADQAFCMGVNMLVLHCYALQPWLNARPGQTMNFWGTHFSRTQTWWEQSRPWFDYLARCQYLLQQGHHVADIVRLAENTGDVDGYKADACSEEVVLTRMSVRDGRIMLPHGASYRLLMLPDRPVMLPEVLHGIEKLVAAGATIVGPKPQRSPSLNNFPDADQALRALAGKMWGACDGKTVTEHAYGKGRVVWGKTPGQVLAGDSVPRDFSCGECPAEAFPARDPADAPTSTMLFIHRALGETDIYYVSNQEAFHREIEARFRVSGKTPMLWHPESGKMEPAPIFREQDGRTLLPLRFDPSGSVFVVFQPRGAGAEASGHLVAARRLGKHAASKAQPLPPLEIHRAVYSASDRSGRADVTAAVQALAKGGTLEVKVEPALAGFDPAPGRPKQLKIEYIVRDNRRLKTVPDGQVLRVPECQPAAPWPPFELVNSAVGAPALRAWEAGTYELATASGRTLQREVAALPEPLAIGGAWEVNFAPGLGAPDKVTLPELVSWSKHAAPGVRYFSGTATYRKRFTLPAGLSGKGRVLMLDLGAVKNLAEVAINGRNLGILWRPPFRVDATAALRSGENDLEIKVTNLWPNRMIGDEQEPDDCQWGGPTTWQHSDPPEQVGRPLQVIPGWLVEGKPRPSKGRVTFTTWKFFDKDTPLLDAGLLGPVVLHVGQDISLER